MQIGEKRLNIYTYSSSMIFNRLAGAADLIPNSITVNRPVPITVPGNFWAPFCGSNNLERMFASLSSYQTKHRFRTHINHEKVNNFLENFEGYMVWTLRMQWVELVSSKFPRVVQQGVKKQVFCFFRLKSILKLSPFFKPTCSRTLPPPKVKWRRENVCANQTLIVFHDVTLIYAK